MPRELFEHMIEEADCRFDVVSAGPVEIDGDRNLRLGRLAGNGSLARHWDFARGFRRTGL
jgi:hypothetical protein